MRLHPQKHRPSPIRNSALTFIGALAVLSADLAAQQIGGEWREDHSFFGMESYDHFGYWVSGEADFNLDQCPDLLVGAPEAKCGQLEKAGRVSVYSGMTGEVIMELEGEAELARFGSSVIALDDLNDDGYPEIAVGAPYSSANGLPKSGSVYVLSGRTGEQLQRFDGSKANINFGWALERVKDIDGDQVDELFVGAPFAEPNGLERAGSAVLISSLTGMVLYRFDCPRDYAWFGSALGDGGDMNDDGVTDLLVGATFYDPSGRETDNAGAGFAFSGATGEQLGVLTGEFKGDMLGNALDGIGDVNGDGCSDVVVGAYLTKKDELEGTGSVYVISGKDKQWLYKIDGLSPMDRFGWSAAGIGDFNGDGIPDFAAGAPNVDVGGVRDVGCLYVFSGADGTPLKKYEGSGELAHFGASVAPLGDLNADGYPEIAVGSWRSSQNGKTEAGAVKVFGHNPYLAVREFSISAAGGGQIEFFVDFPATDIGRSYALLGSLVGTGPTYLDNVAVPLYWDSLFQVLLSGDGPEWLHGATGTLDGFGNAVALMDAPAGELTSVIGNTIHFAAICFETTESGGMEARRSSVAVQVEILP